MDYKINDLCKTLNLGVSKFYRLKSVLDSSIPEQNRTEYYYNKGRNFYITEKGFNWFKDNISCGSKSASEQESNGDIVLYQNQIIELYKKENEYLKQENQRLLDVIALKEQKELAKEVHYLDGNNTPDDNVPFLKRLFGRKHS